MFVNYCPISLYDIFVDTCGLDIILRLIFITFSAF